MTTLTGIKYLVVHCSATKPSMDIGVKEIRQWHKDRGWSDIGYHMVIRRDGTLEFGRGLGTVGAHVKGYNRESIGICMIGGIDLEGKAENNFNKEQFKTLGNVLQGLLLLLPENNIKVKGHRDFPNVHKECPCFDLETFCMMKMLPYEPKD